MFPLWQAVSQIKYDYRVNREHGEGYWPVQSAWAIYFQIWYEKYSDGYGVI